MVLGNSIDGVVLRNSIDGETSQVNSAKLENSIDGVVLRISIDGVILKNSLTSNKKSPSKKIKHKYKKSSPKNP